MQPDALSFRDDLGIVRKYIPNTSVDLVDLDSPFSSYQALSVTFKNESDCNSDAQQVACDDPREQVHPTEDVPT